MLDVNMSHGKLRSKGNPEVLGAVADNRTTESAIAGG